MATKRFHRQRRVVHRRRHNSSTQRMSTVRSWEKDVVLDIKSSDVATEKTKKWLMNHSVPSVPISADTKKTERQYYWLTPKRATSTVMTTDEHAPEFHDALPCGQEQIPLFERIAKAVHEESLPWLLTFLLAAVPAFVVQHSLPLFSVLFAEAFFFCCCTYKYVTKFNIPVLPEPLLVEREWNDVVNFVWSSHSTVSSRRTFLMGWFYDAPFDRLRREDAFTYLAWMRYGVPAERGYLTANQIDCILNFDLQELERNVNYGHKLPLRMHGEQSLPCTRFNLEPLRYRHKPLIFYFVTHGAFFLLQKVLRNLKFVYVRSSEKTKGLSYWYRGSVKLASSERTPLVFAHGVGGLVFYFNLIEKLVESVNDGDVPIILIDLPHVSLRVCDEIPGIPEQVRSICTIMDDVIGKYPGTATPRKATFVGHSFGSILLSWIVQSRPERVAGCVFIDPICFQLHLKSVLFNFHMQRVDKRLQKGRRWVHPFSLSALINMAGTEMHTNNAMLRKFSWASNILFPEDLTRNGIPCTILLSELDDIVPTSEIDQLFREFNNKNMKTGTCDHVIIDCQVVKGASHGDMILKPNLSRQTASIVSKMMINA